MEIEATPSSLRICLVQMDLAWENPQLNWSKASNLLRDEVGKHDLIILPEMFTTGFSMKPAPLAESAEDGDTLAWMQFHAAKLGAIVVGSLIVEEDGKYYNRLMVVGQEGLVLKYDKRHLFRMSGENEVYAAGDELPVFSLNGWRICPMICYDLRFPVWSRNNASLKKKNTQPEYEYDVLIYVANWPKVRSYPWKQLLIARAIENQCYVIGVNRVGKDGKGNEHSGDSMVIDPKGKVIGKLKPGSTGIIHAEINKVTLEEFRKNFPAAMDADSFNIRI